jgi:hypothetical protein
MIFKIILRQLFYYGQASKKYNKCIKFFIEIEIRWMYNLLKRFTKTFK